MSKDKFIREVLKVVADADLYDSLFWHSNLNFFINCNDLFAWAVADAEPLTEETFDVFLKAIDDAKNSCDEGEIYADLLYCCRMRQMRPQTPYYKEIPEEMHELFNECGEERDD